MRIAMRPCLSQYIAIHILVAIPIPTNWLFDSLSHGVMWYKKLAPGFEFEVYVSCTCALRTQRSMAMA